MLRRVITFFLLCLFWISAFAGMTKDVFAADDFATTYDIKYDVTEDGITSVSEKVVLRNLSSQYYASEYKVTIGATDIWDVSAKDSSGQQLGIKSERKSSATQITIDFNQQVAGIDKKFSWELLYKSRDFARRVGKVWEITLPKSSSRAKMDDYRLTLSVPIKFGEPTIMTPSPKSQTTSDAKMQLRFEKEQLQNSGVALIFGNSQLYDFELIYSLENSSILPMLTNIALPANTDFQDVMFKKIDPEPINVTTDEDGNYLAWYRLRSGQKISVKAIGTARLFAKSKVKNPELPALLRQKYLNSDKYWETNNPVIKSKLNEILKDHPNATSSEKIGLIYRYVVNILKYDPGRISDKIERFGAVAALNNPTSAVCMEFTDLFITFARAAGIPARELDGYGFSANSALRPSSLRGDVLHAWPEYWDETKGWVMVDPTWENTTQGVDYFNKFDLSHIVFVTKGLSSDKPVPAGSYKYKGSETQDVKITLSEVEFLDMPNLETEIEVSDELIAGFPMSMKVNLINKSGSAQEAASFSVNSNKLLIQENGTSLDLSKQNIGVIPPFGHAQFVYNVRTKSFFDFYSDTITITINNQKFEKKITVYPFFVFKMFPFVFALIVGSIAGVYMLILGIMLYRKKFKHKLISKVKKTIHKI